MSEALFLILIESNVQVGHTYILFCSFELVKQYMGEVLA